MYMRILCIFSLIFCLTASGCVSPRYSDRSAREELRKSKASIDQINEQMLTLNKELETLKKELQEVKGVKIKEDKTAKSEEEAASDQEAPVLEKHVAVKEKAKKAVSVPEPEKKEKIKEVDISKKEGTKKAPDKKPAIKDQKTPRIKVLSGNGKLVPARDMSKKLMGMGYKIEDIGIASRTDFRENTIYYASDYQKEAEQMETRLGGDTVSRPLTWPSVYHLIVVTVP